MSFPFVQPYFGLGNSLQTAQAGGAAGVGGWVELARTTLGSSNANINISSIPDKRYYMLLSDIDLTGAGTVKFKLYWTTTGGSSTQTVDFDLAGVGFANDNPMDTAVGTAQNVTDTWIADDDLHVSAYSSAITISGSPAAGELVVFQLSRDVAADDLGVDAEVVGVLLEYSTDASNSS